MTFMKRYALAAALAGVSSFATSPVHAFMMEADVAAVEGSVDITATVDQLRQDWKAGETKCELMLEKIDAAIEQVDASLDKGVVDEKKYLGLRDELVELRLELPCLAEELTQSMINDGSTLLSETVIGEAAPCVGCDGSGSAGAGMAGGGGSGLLGGGGGAGGAGGIGGIGPLALGGIAAAIAIPLAVGSDDPGTPASPSTP
jgi:hypothetical protein